VATVAAFYRYPVKSFTPDSREPTLAVALVPEDECGIGFGDEVVLEG
jgi:hypothetical protein